MRKQLSEFGSSTVIRQPSELLAAFDGEHFRRHSHRPAGDRDICRLTATASVGSGHLDYVTFNDDFVTIFPRLHIGGDFPVRFADSNWVRMHFRLAGHNITFFDRARREMHGAFCNLMRLPEGMVATEVHADRQVGWVTVFCRAEFLRREFRLDDVALPARVEAALGDGAPDLVLENRRLPLPAGRLLQEVDLLPLDGALGVVRCEAVVTELVCLLLEALSDPGPPAAVMLSRAEVDRLEHARQLIRDSADAPPTLAALARAVGTNRTSLTRGFRSLFGHTVFEAIQQERMALARRLLDDRSMNISEVAQAIGYSSAAGFSHAFRKFWGMAPREARAPH